MDGGQDDDGALGGAYSELVDELKRDMNVKQPTTLLNDDLSDFGVPDPRILICGCGGSGNNTMNRITHLGVEGAITVAINTDKQHLDHTRALQKLLVGRHITRGLGAGGDPTVGRRCAEAGREVITQIVSGADLVFITAGLGGGTGTGIAPVVAEEAKRAGALVVAVVTTPFQVERRQRMLRALEGLEMLRQEADAVLVLDNNRLLHYVPNLPLDEAFSIMDQLIAEIVKGIVETITLPSLINLDFADVRIRPRSRGGRSRIPQSPVARHRYRWCDRCTHPCHRWALHDAGTGQSGRRSDDRALVPGCQCHLRCETGSGLR